VTALVIEASDLARICRDLAWSEIASMPGLREALGDRLCDRPDGQIFWGENGLALDSLARMQLATAAATWCNAYDAGFEDLFLAKRSVADWVKVMQRARTSGAQHFTFSTSGTTGARKHIRHREDVLFSEAVGWVDVLNGTHPGATPSMQGQHVKRVLVLVPTHHIYGFIWGVLVPMALGVTVVDADLNALPEVLPGDLIVAVPDQWAWLAGSQSAKARRTWPEGVQGVSSTAPLADSIHSELVSNDCSGPASSPMLQRLLQIYGSSETAGLAWRADSTQPYTLAPGRRRSSDNGIKLVLPSGSMVSMAVQDQLAWVDGDHFHLAGRSDQSVQVGGHNVSPSWVKDQLLSHPAVKHASVRLDTHTKPPRLKAFVVLNTPDDPSTKSTLENWTLNTLPWFACLHSFTYGAALPLNAMGKPSDWQT
jgi:long-chain acyl-CoA synthetase